MVHNQTNMPFSVNFLQQTARNPGTSAGRPVDPCLSRPVSPCLSRPGVPETLGRCPDRFLKFVCLFPGNQTATRNGGWVLDGNYRNHGQTKTTRKRKRHININFVLWWGDAGTTSQLTGQNSLCVLLRIKKIKHFLLVNLLVVPGLTGFSKSVCVKSLCAFSLAWALGFWNPPRLPLPQSPSKLGLPLQKLRPCSEFLLL